MLDGDTATSPHKGYITQFSAQPAGCIKMPLGTEVGLCPGHNVLAGDPAPPRKGHSLPNVRPMSIMAKRLGGS